MTGGTLTVSSVQVLTTNDLWKDQGHVPIMMFTGSAETPSVMDINTSRNRPPMRMQNAIQSGLRQPCTN